MIGFINYSWRIVQKPGLYWNLLLLNCEVFSILYFLFGKWVLKFFSWLWDRFSRKSRSDIFNQSIALLPRNSNSSGAAGKKKSRVWERTYCKWRGSHFIVCPALHSLMSQLKMNLRKSHLGMVVKNCTFGFYLKFPVGLLLNSLALSEMLSVGGCSYSE